MSLRLVFVLLFFWASSGQAEEDAMAAARKAVRAAHGGTMQWMAIAERLETTRVDGDQGFVWEGQGWFGGDINRAWLKTEGEYSFEEDLTEEFEAQLLYSRAVRPFWDLQAGVMLSTDPGDHRTYGVVGYQGLAPYWFEVDAAALLSEEGDVSFRMEAEYDLRITQRLLLQPRTEFKFSLSDDTDKALASGPAKVALGLRLRYEIRPWFAPYAGVSWSKALGDTADLVEDVEQFKIVAGLRVWF